MRVRYPFGPETRTSRPWSKRIAYVAISVATIGAITLAVLEMLVRAFAPQQAPTLWLRPDARYGHTLKANFHQRYPFLGSDFVMDVRTNAQGLRDEPLASYTQGVKTILFLGDSFTFGQAINIEDRMDTQLEALCRTAGLAFRYINAGVSGWGTLQAARYGQDNFDVFRPDIIVLTFCENDPYDDAYFLARGVSFDQVKFPGKTFLRKHFHLFRFLQYQYLLFLLNQKTRVETQVPEEGQNEETTAHPEVAKPVGEMVIPQAYWDKTAQYVRDFHAAFLKFNPQGVLLLQAGNPTNADIRKHLRALGNGANLIYVDLAEAVSRIPPEQRRLPYDGHWSRKMHAISAQHLYDAIRQAARPEPRQAEAAKPRWKSGQ